MLRKLVLFVCLFQCLSGSIFSQVDQDFELAQQYYSDGLYEKALPYYKKVYHNRASLFYFKRYYDVLLKVKDYDEAEKITKKEIKNNPDELSLLIDLGFTYQLQEENKKATEKFDAVVNNLSYDKNQISLIANAFQSIQNKEYALQTYLEGQKKMGSLRYFNSEIASIYETKKDIKNAIKHYLLFAQHNLNQLQDIKDKFQQLFSENDKYIAELEKQLYAAIQGNTDNYVFSELLIWQFIQQEDFETALNQSIALDRRLKENGQKLTDLADILVENKQYDLAIKAYSYILERKDPRNFHYELAKKGVIQVRKEKILHSDYSQQDLQIIKNTYKKYLRESKKNQHRIDLYRELAELEARYLHNLDSAIFILEEALTLTDVSRRQLALCKFDLGDYHLMNGNPWDAILLYTQVEKKFKDEELGEMAKYKNAKVSYYNGEFEWAQAQLDVLKASTTELIANDALDLSVFIMDHYRLDTTAIPMNLFARADLLLFQNKLNQADAVFDSIELLFPNHDLLDDVAYKKASIYVQQQQTEKAIASLEKLINSYYGSILQDDALFMVAQLYEQMGDIEKSMKYYESLIFRFKDSAYTVAARKHYRKLRGDAMN